MLFPGDEGYDPIKQQDANQLGLLFDDFRNYLFNHPYLDEFAQVMNGALWAEFELRDANAYPPPGHGYARLDG
ncbi:hypothetical protein ACWFR5_06625 [Streptomyces sp. NPDC055092]